jgi:hypothetical protein
MPTNGQFSVGELVTASDANTLFVRGYGNRIINGNFEINQRGYTSGTNLASGAYGFDRWKSGFTNTALTFTDGVQNTTVTISSSGVLQQIIERENMPAGTYILSWFGTATGRIYNAGSTPPGYTAGPITVTLDGSANVVVEFTASGDTRTLGLVQVEAGTVFSPFDYRHRGQELILCQRYYYRVTNTGSNRAFCLGWADSSTVFVGTIPFPQTMRARPSALITTGTASDYTAIGPGVSMTASSITYDGTSADFQGTIVLSGGGGLTTGRGGQIRSNSSTAFFAWDVEL